MDPTTALQNKLKKIAEEDAHGRSYEPTRSVYVIEVENISENNNWDYYVGYTGNSIETRFQEHLDDSGRDKCLSSTCCHFKKESL